MRKKFLIGYVIFVHLFLLVVLVKSDFITRVGYRFGLIRHFGPEITQHFERMVRYHERMDANVPDGAAIFIGDSITQGLCVSAVVTPSVNYGIGSDTTVGVLKRLPEYRSLERASVCVMAIGVNDLQRRGNEKILKNYSSILQAIPQQLPLVISSVLPVDERIRENLAGTNTRIKELNSGLQALCEAQSPNCTFVDPGSKLIDPSGNLRKEYDDGDGVHLNGAGNSIWIQELKGVIKRAQPRAQNGPEPRGEHLVVLFASSLTEWFRAS
jgi:lysophospholipase L1-like esterase